MRYPTEWGRTEQGDFYQARFMECSSEYNWRISNQMGLAHTVKHIPMPFLLKGREEDNVLGCQAWLSQSVASSGIHDLNLSVNRPLFGYSVVTHPVAQLFSCNKPGNSLISMIGQVYYMNRDKVYIYMTQAIIWMHVYRICNCIYVHTHGST